MWKLIRDTSVRYNKLLCQGRGDTIKYTSHRQLVSCRRTPLFYLFTPVSFFLPFFFAFFFLFWFVFVSFSFSFELRYLFTYAPFLLFFVGLFACFFRTPLFYLRHFRSSPLSFFLPSFHSSIVPFFLSIFWNPQFIGRWRCQRPQSTCSAEAILLGPYVALMRMVGASKKNRLTPSSPLVYGIVCSESTYESRTKHGRECRHFDSLCHHWHGPVCKPSHPPVLTHNQTVRTCGHAKWNFALVSYYLPLNQHGWSTKNSDSKQWSWSLA